MSEPIDPTGDGTPPAGGRRADGRFAAGHKFGKGNPNAAKAQRIRAALFKAVKPADIAEAVRTLMASAKSGDRQALSEILDRTIGRPASADMEERVAALEEALARQQGEYGPGLPPKVG